MKSDASLQMRLKAETYRPAYALTVDHDTQSVVLAIRGSMNSGDLLTDAVSLWCYYVS